jgi:hypothetical protein
VYALELPDRLASSLASADSGSTPLLGLATAGGELCEDLADVPRTAKYLALRGNARGLDQLAHMRALEAVWASGVTPGLVEALASLPRLRALNLYQVGRTDLTGVGNLRGVEHLLIGWANQLTDVSWLAQLPRLKTLVVEDTPRLDLDSLSPLPGLRALQLGGGVWKVLKLASLAPLARLPGLRSLDLSSIAVADGALDVIARLPALQTFRGPNIFEVEESARASALRPDLTANVLQPIFAEAGLDAQGNPIFPCKACGGPMLMPTGRRTPLLCPSCDSARIRKHVARWESARAGAGAREQAG